MLRTTFKDSKGTNIFQVLKTPSDFKGYEVITIYEFSSKSVIEAGRFEVSIKSPTSFFESVKWQMNETNVITYSRKKREANCESFCKSYYDHVSKIDSNELAVMAAYKRCLIECQ